MRPRILLLRRPTSPDPYVAAFESAGFDAASVPVLDFEPAGRDALAERIAEPEKHGGLLVTSPRGADALRGLDLRGWAGKPTFVVGPRTAEDVRALGLAPVGEEAGHADALADRIIADPPAKPLLFLCGDLRRDVLPDRLLSAGVAFDELVVYRTIGDASALEAYLAQPLDWLAFFSPSGVEAALELDGISWNSLSAAAIGPTTADALRAAGIHPAAVAASPTPEALVAAVTSASLDA
jgi:uroporphyrinogen-III synthase